jgi:hypothetical protein
MMDTRSALAQTAQRFKTFTLRPLFSEETQLVLDSESDVAVQLVAGEVVEVQHFTTLEVVVAETFLESYPDYAPHEVVLSAMTGKSVERCRARILTSIEENGTVDPVMRPVRNLLGRTRDKLRPFGIEIKALPQMGYLLVPLRKKMRV